MSTGFVIPDISCKQILSELENLEETVITDDGDHYTIRMLLDADYSLEKRIKMAQLVKAAPDNVQQGGVAATIFLIKSQDPNNAWFWGTATLVNHPEYILNTIAERIQLNWYSEHDEEYWEISNSLN